MLLFRSASLSLPLSRRRSVSRSAARAATAQFSVLLSILLAILLPGLAISACSADTDAAATAVNDTGKPETGQPLPAVDPDDLIMQRWLGLGIITAYGTAKWDYFSGEPRLADEGWFARDTQYGGADKLGHFYSAYLVTALLDGRYQDWGYPDQEAARLAAGTSLLWLGYMELGDSFSDYGFSSEDMLMNGLGSYAGYLMARHETWARRIDFRVEHDLQGSSSDPLTDYDRLKFLMAIKLDGFAALQHSPWSWLELQLGYYTRGYDSAAADQRTLYVGVSLNLARLLREQGWPKSARVLNFVQLPHTTLSAEHPLDPVP